MALFPRIIIGQSGGNPQFAMSKAGVSVLTAGNVDKVFDIAFAGAQSKGFLGQYIKGSQLVNAPSPQASIQHTYNFPKTFAVEPVCFAWLEGGLGEIHNPFYYYSYIIGIPVGYQIIQFRFGFTVSTTQLVMTYVNTQDDNPTGGSSTHTHGVNGDYVFRWIVCQT